ncbi:MAG: DUF2190 family protein [Synergistaceae bacterium]
MKNYVSKGEVIKATLSSAVTSGSAVLIGDTLAIACGTYGANEAGEYLISGIVTVPATSTDTFTVGGKVYWDDTNKKITTTSTSNKQAGIYIAANGSGFADIKL